VAGIPGFPEDPVSDGGKVPALHQRFSHDKHAEQEYHHIRIDGTESIAGGNLAGKEYRKRSSEHDLPDLQVEPARLPYCYQQENCGKHDDCEVRDGVFAFPER
jgi:hypothetical protein